MGGSGGFGWAGGPCAGLGVSVPSRGSHYDLRVSAPGPPHLTGGLSWAGGPCVEGGAWGFYKGLGGSAGLKVPVLSGGLGPRAPMKGWGSLRWARGLRLRTPTLGSRDPTLNRGVGPWDPLPQSQGAWQGWGSPKGFVYPPTPAVYRLCVVPPCLSPAGGAVLSPLPPAGPPRPGWCYL